MDLNVVAKIRIMPDDVETDLTGITVKLSEIVGAYGKLHSSEIKPIAFGLNAIEANLLLDDGKGGLDDLVEKIKDITGVADVELQEASRL